MSIQPALPGRFLPATLSLAGFCMTAMSIALLISAAKLGIFIRMLLGLIGVVFVDSLILAYVATRITVVRKGEATLGEKAVLCVMAICTGLSLAFG